MGRQRGHALELTGDIRSGSLLLKAAIAKCLVVLSSRFPEELQIVNLAIDRVVYRGKVR